jgi:hypothetical protein
LGIVEESSSSRASYSSSVRSNLVTVTPAAPVRRKFGLRIICRKRQNG